jgi:hypothetical protein
MDIATNFIRNKYNSDKYDNKMKTLRRAPINAVPNTSRIITAAKLTVPEILYVAYLYQILHQSGRPLVAFIKLAQNHFAFLTTAIKEREACY